MFSLKIPSKLGGYGDTDLERLKNEALGFLRERQFDWVGCADFLGIPVLALLELRSRYWDEFAELQARFIAQCETTVVRAALGHIELGEEEVQRQVAHCKWVLERQAPGWNKTQKIAVEDKAKIIDVTPRVQELLEDHERKIESLRVRGQPRESVETSES